MSVKLVKAWLKEFKITVCASSHADVFSLMTVLEKEAKAAMGNYFRDNRSQEPPVDIEENDRWFILYII